LVTERSALLAALALDLEEGFPDFDGVVPSVEVAPCAYALAPPPKPAAHAIATAVRNKNGFMMYSAISE
jgi:hypothetical protein